jgi:hypothetical protein
MSFDARNVRLVRELTQAIDLDILKSGSQYPRRCSTNTADSDGKDISSLNIDRITDFGNVIKRRPKFYGTRSLTV